MKPEDLYNLVTQIRRGKIEQAMEIIDKQDENGRTPLLFALETRRFDFSKELIESGADLDAATPEGLTPMHLAAINGYGDLFEIMIENGADVNVPDKNGHTPLWHAKKAKKDKVIKVLKLLGGTL